MIKQQHYAEITSHISGLIKDEKDLISIMSTIVCELHHNIELFDWTGFYRVVAPGILKVGPYQGGHGCLTIPFDKGVCGKCAREVQTQLIRDIREIPYHIACSTSTRSEIVVAVFDDKAQIRAVLDIDSDTVGAFDEVDRQCLEEICGLITPVFTT